MLFIQWLCVLSYDIYIMMMAVLCYLHNDVCCSILSICIVVVDVSLCYLHKWCVLSYAICTLMLCATLCYLHNDVCYPILSAQCWRVLPYAIYTVVVCSVKYYLHIAVLCCLMLSTQLYTI